MKINKYILLLIPLFFVFSSFSQKSYEIKGEKSYEVFSYTESIEKFEAITEKTTDIKRKLAESYYKTGDYDKSEAYYKDVVYSVDFLDEDIYNYAYVLSVNEKYTESKKWMNKYANIHKDDLRAEKFLEEAEYFDQLFVDQEQFKIKNLEINTSHQDFGASYYKGQIVFASSRTKARFVKRMWNWNELPFLDLFVAEEENNELSNPKQFLRSVNKKYHEGPASFNKAGTYMAYTRNNYEEKSENNAIKLQIFFSELIDDNWSKPIAFPFNSKEYSVGHASLNEEGNIIYFASDMPGGYGGADIYKSVRNLEGTWGKPVNLGKDINTEGNEMFPFIHKNGFLFYASNGLPGLGGLDVFFVKIIEDNKFSNPKNLGLPINSSKDDFSFILNDKMKKGYFSSNREDGKGDDDIYFFRLMKPLKTDLILKGKTLDNKGNILTQANVSLYNDPKNIRIKHSDSEGNFQFRVSQDDYYNINGMKEGYISDHQIVVTKGKEGVIYQDLILKKTPDYYLICEVKDSYDSTCISDVYVEYKEKNTETYINDSTNTDGEIQISLDEFKHSDSINYNINFEKSEYISTSYRYEEILDAPGEYSFIVFMSKIKTGEDLGKILKINPIYFDFDKHNIRIDAATELDKIVKIMNEYPNMVVELASHTDCRGASIYNTKLSNRRAKSSVEYIMKRISNPTRITGEGFGESQLINNCNCEGNVKSDCSEEKHQENRRTEFKVIRK